MPAISKREQILDKALSLFYKHGFNATGIDKIITEAGVSKKTLYNHFKTKDELILATLRKRDELFRNFLMRETEKSATKPKERLLALFDIVDKWFHEKEFFGCMFINASAEFSNTDNPSHLFCGEHKRLVRDYIESIATQAGSEQPEELANQINLLIEGAIVCAHVMGDKGAAIRAKNMAELIIEKALP